jgi:hypothetical protein
MKTSAPKAARKSAEKAVSQAEKRMKKGTKQARKGIKEARRSASAMVDRVTDGDALAKLEELAARAQKRLNEAHLDERAAELAERLRESEALAKAQAKGGQLASQAQKAIADAHLDERVAELGEKVRDRFEESGLDDRLQELGDRVRSSDAAAKAKRVADEGLAAAGAWLATGRSGEALGVAPRKRRFPTWLAAVLGVVAGYAIGVLTAPKRGEALREDLWRSAEDMAGQAQQQAAELTTALKESAEAAADKPLALTIRETLHQDPRTTELPDLTINVAEGTVFVRGTVPGTFDEDTVRAVIEAVPGVHDVDLQVHVSS